ncbi:MAG: DUF3810 domain-containing protein [Spirochaetota bacterium]|jgi:hypothetical protein|nr:DUF3810 domain-containing protein [Spirochaetota bacterium]
MRLIPWCHIRNIRTGSRITFIVLFFFFVCLMLFPRNSELTEKIYYRAFFAPIVSVLAPIADSIPFSVHEALVIGLLVLVFRASIRLIRRFRCPRMVFFAALRRSLRRLFIIAVWGIALFYFLWGFNYFRPRLTEKSAFSEARINREAAVTLLSDCCTALQELEREQDLGFKDKMLPEIENAVTETAQILYGMKIRSAKRIKYFLSGILSLGAFSGVSLPLLPEAHIAADLYDHEKPFVIAHEKAHLKGCAPESEANYIAILACLSAKNAAIRYSGVLALTSLLLSALPKSERAVWISKISRYTLRNLQAPAIRHLSRNKRIAALLRAVYGTYLKAQRIPEGMANYSAALKLVLGYAIDQNEPLRLITNTHENILD